MDISTSQSVEQVIQLSETMEKTGVAITVVAVFLLIVLICAVVFITSFIRKENKREEQYGTLLKEIMEQNQTFTEHVLNKPQVPQYESQAGLFKTSVECGAIVEEHLKYLFSKTKADRVAVYVFHNGQRMLNGSHLLKCSCLSEYALLDKFFLSTQHKDTPISQLSPICNMLLDKGHFYSEDTSEVVDPTLKTWIDRYGYKSMFVSAIFNTQGEIIGFVSVDYIDYKVYPDKIKVTKEEIKRLADKVTVAIDADIIK